MTGRRALLAALAILWIGQEIATFLTGGFIWQ